MSARDDILAAIRAHVPKLDRSDPAIPLFDKAAPANLVEQFSAMLKTMGGELLAADDADPLAPVCKMLDGATVVCSSTPEVRGNKPISEVTKPSDLADVEIGVARAAFAVAETGSVCFTEVELGVNTLGYLPQHLVVLVDPADIVPNIHHAYRRAEWRSARYAVLQTGPSATADIEGVLVHGAQGVRSLSVLLHPRPSDADLSSSARR